MSTITFSQSTGIITQEDGAVVVPAGLAWAGHDVPGGVQGRNNPKAQDVVGVGPLPQGLYRVGAWGDAQSVHGYPAHLGPHIASLTQIDGQTFGRSGFFIHGPGGADPRQSSKGCIEIEHDYRLNLQILDPSFIRVTE